MVPPPPHPGKQSEEFTFSTFYHPQVKILIKELNKNGVEGLLKRSLQTQDDTILFKNNYSPTKLVNKAYPDLDEAGRLEFRYNGAYSLYNWELFYHVPMNIAASLYTDQRFDEARKWFHYVFDPTKSEPGGKERFWQFRPFYDEAKKDIQTLAGLLADAAALKIQVDKWKANPFNPHVIARMRINAYMKNVLLKYLDNLIAWGDQLFRRDTIENINEATNLYILAAEILGDRPQNIPPRAVHAEYCFDDLKNNLNSFTLAMVDIETFISPSAFGGTASSGHPLGEMFNFCVPRNEFLLKYWDIVADRLFKIRRSMNIEGITRILPLYEPPIDPGLLVKAAAAGMDLSSILSDISTPLPNYRFVFMLQKANELVNDVKSLGASLLQALEKRDAETMSLLRSGHEQKLLSATLFIREQQVDDAQAMLDSSQKSFENAEQRFEYYNGREFMNLNEKAHLSSIQLGMILSQAQGGANLIGGILAQIPNFKLGSPFSIGVTYGGENLAFLMRATSEYLGIIAGINNAAGSMISTIGGFQRRMDDWRFQASIAAKDMEQLDKQIISAGIKLAIAKKELENHLLQIDNAREVDEFMRNKFTNEELYDWMVNQLSSVYFQSYQLAYDIAKKAEKCYHYELSEEEDTSFIQFGYWDSLKKGLLSAEKLQYDLRRMETTYLEKNKRLFELTKHFPLMLNDPMAIMDLRRDGTCLFSIPEALFDLDFPGHYFRRIKSVSLTIPCVAGPYTTISGTLRLISHTTRIRSNKSAPYTSTNYAADPAFRHVPAETISVATSSAQNDSGVFELNFRDERWLPFEGCGAFGEWQFSLNTDPDKVLRLFDYNTISDVILHIKYTALEDTLMVQPVQDYLKGILQNTLPASIQLWRGFSLKQDYSNEWYKMLHPVPAGTKTHFSIEKDRFPFIAQAKNIEIITMHLFAFVNVDDDYLVTITPDAAPAKQVKLDLKTLSAEPYRNSKTGLTINPGQFTIEVSRSGAPAVAENDLKDIVLVLEYHLI